jgi:hypothetical protein
MGGGAYRGLSWDNSEPPGASSNEAFEKDELDGDRSRGVVLEDSGCAEGGLLEFDAEDAVRCGGCDGWRPDVRR